MSDIEFNKMIIDLELRSLLDMNGWRELTELERQVLTIKEQNNLLGLCPKDFTIDKLDDTLLETKKLREKITLSRQYK